MYVSHRLKLSACFSSFTLMITTQQDSNPKKAQILQFDGRDFFFFFCIVISHAIGE